MAGTVVHYGFSNPQYHGLVERYAKARGLGCRHVHITTSMFQAASVLKHAALVVIWNGMQAQGPQAARLCRRRGIPHVFFEWGMLPQSETFLVDPSGFCGDSVLCRDLSWVTDEDMDRMLERRAELRERYPRTDEGFVLVPLQILNDTQVLYHTDLKDMTELVRRVAELYPDREIVVRPHPKSNGKVPAEWFGPRMRVERRGDFFEWASRASVVVGATSTCLLESAVYGVPVVALGEHPLRAQADHDRVAAGALALTLRRADGDLGAVLDRFGIEPLDVPPIPQEVRVAAPGSGGGKSGPTKTPDYYARTYDRLYARGYHKRTDWSHAHKALIPWVLEHTTGRVLDVGCSNGAAVAKLAEAGREAVGVDVSVRAVRAGRKLGRDLRLGSATDLRQFRDGEFDVVMSSDTLEHLFPEDVPAAVAEMCRVCRPGGWVCIKAPNRMDLSPEWKQAAGHDLHLTVRPIEWWAERFAGLGEVVWTEGDCLAVRLKETDA